MRSVRFFMAKRKRMSEAYKERLARWVEEQLESPKIQSERHFSEVLGVTYTTVQGWRKKQRKTALQEDSINAIAAYKRETPAQVRAWLNGVEPDEESINTDLAARLERAEEKIAQLQDAISTLMEAPMSWVTICIQDTLIDADIDWRTEIGIKQLLTLLEKEDRGRWDESVLVPILKGYRMPSPEETAPLSRALNEVSDGDWPSGRLQKLIMEDEQKALKNDSNGSKARDQRK